jgi:hypothetical protein
MYLRVTPAAVHQAPSICWRAKRAPLAFVLDENDSGALPGSVRTSAGSTLNIGINRWKASSLFKRCPESRFRMAVPRLKTIAARSRAASARVPAIAYCQGTPLRNEIEAGSDADVAEATSACARAIAKRFGARPSTERSRHTSSSPSADWVRASLACHSRTARKSNRLERVY